MKLSRRTSSWVSVAVLAILLLAPLVRWQRIEPESWYYQGATYKQDRWSGMILMTYYRDDVRSTGYVGDLKQETASRLVRRADTIWGVATALALAWAAIEMHTRKR